MARYATSSKATILHKSGQNGIIKPKTLLSRIVIEDIKKHGNWDEFVRDGWIVEVSDKEAKDYGIDPDLVPVKGNVDQTPGKGAASRIELQAGKKADSSGKIPEPSASEDERDPEGVMKDPANQKARVTGQWNKDPKSLKGKKLEALNAMIAEIDHRIEPATSVDEAIQILSADFA